MGTFWVDFYGQIDWTERNWLFGSHSHTLVTPIWANGSQNKISLSSLTTYDRGSQPRKCPHSWTVFLVIKTEKAYILTRADLDQNFRINFSNSNFKIRNFVKATNAAEVHDTYFERKNDGILYYVLLIIFRAFKFLAEI